MDARTDSEIHFNGRATLENGLKIHMRVELEGQDATSPGRKDDIIDEYYLSVSGAFGQIIMGGTGGAPIKMLTGLSGSWATGVGESLTYNSNSWTPSAAGNFYVHDQQRAHAGPRRGQGDLHLAQVRRLPGRHVLFAGRRQ